MKELQVIYRDVLKYGWKILILNTFDTYISVATYPPYENIEYWNGLARTHAAHDAMNRNSLHLHTLWLW
jgi:hypothetical protein